MPYKDPEVRRAKAGAYTKAYFDRNPEKLAEKKKRWRIKNRARLNAKARDKWPATYARNREKMLAKNVNRVVKIAGRKRPECCEVCGGLPGRRSLSYDHSHQTGQFRGWLCSNCNCALGLVHDDINRLRKLIAYLERGKNAEPPQRSLPGI